MSSSTEADLIFTLGLTSKENYISVASAVILAYDVLITIDREAAAIWGRKFSGVTVIFLNMRYITLISQFAIVGVVVLPGVLLPCEAASWLYYSTIIWSSIAATVFGAFRVWAIWGRHWILLTLVLLVGLVSAVLNLFVYTRLHIVSIPGTEPLGGCSSFFSLSTDTLTRLSIAGRACALAADAMVLIATWIKTWSIHRVIKSTSNDAGHSNMYLSRLLMRDGTIYFVVLLGLDISALVLDTTPNVIVNPIPSFINSFTAILLCRLILNLRSFNTDSSSVATTNARQMSSVRFANAVLDNIGASISLGEHGDPRNLDNSGHGGANATWDEVVSNPLAIGLEEDIRRKKRDEAIEDEIIEEFRDGDQEIIQDAEISIDAA